MVVLEITVVLVQLKQFRTAKHAPYDADTPRCTRATCTRSYYENKKRIVIYFIFVFPTHSPPNEPPDIIKYS